MSDVTAKFTVNPRKAIETEFRINILSLDHNKLYNRDLPDQHPISAITGLEEALDNVPTKEYIDNGLSELSDDITAENQRAINAEEALQDAIGTKQDILTSENAGTGISIETVGGVVKINNTQNSAEWGQIGGDINQQTDLKTALDNKQNNLTQTQLDAVNSGANTTNIGQIATNTSDIADINALIPNQATTSNQLADQGFVNSSIATNTAYFIGTFNSVAELEAYSGTLTNNDYAFVSTTDTAGNTLYDRYKWNGSQWLFEYELNNSSFTASQWASINSGATTANIAKISTNETTINNHIANTSNPHSVTKAQVGLGNVDNTSDLDKPISTATQTALNRKQDILTAGTNITIDANNVISSTAQESFFRGRWNSWTAVPTDTSRYPEDYNHNRVPTENDYMVVSDTSDYTIEGMEIKIYWDGWGTHRFSVNDSALVAIGGVNEWVPFNLENDVIIYIKDYEPRYGYFGIKCNVDMLVDGSIVPAGNVVQFIESADPRTVYYHVASSNTLSGTWRFAYHGVWSSNGKNGWLPEYQLEDVLPIATPTVAGITKLYTTTGQNTDGTMTQKSITDSLATKQDVISDLATIRSGAALGATAVQPSDLATVATSGDYDDLINKPTIPTDTSDLTNGAGFITGITSSDVTTALGYTPYNSTNPNGYITSSALNGYATENYVDTGLSGKQATLVSGTNIKTINNQSLLGSGNINIQGGGAVNSVNGQTGTVVLTASDVGALPDSTVIPTEATVSGWGFTKNVGTVTRVNNVAPVNGNVSLSIPRVYNSTITFTQGGVSKGSFTLNQSTGATIELDAGGGGSDVEAFTAAEVQTIWDNN